MAERWWARARCQQKWVDMDWFHSDRGGSPEPALKVCRHCPVTEECLEDALREEAAHSGEPTGVRGGLSANERKPLVRERKKAAKRQESATTQKIRQRAAAGMTQVDIARELDMSREAVGAQLKRAAERDRRRAEQRVAA